MKRADLDQGQASRRRSGKKRVALHKTGDVILSVCDSCDSYTNDTKDRYRQQFRPQISNTRESSKRKVKVRMKRSREMGEQKVS